MLGTALIGVVMRILLVALNAQEGDLDGNLASHIAMLRRLQPRAAT
jgi:predicted amidohydrolase